MAPQPISKVFPGASLSLTPELMAERPLVSAKIACCIALWSWIDTQIGSLFVSMAGPQREETARQWVEWGSDAKKAAALKTAALTVLSKEETSLLDRIIIIANGCKKDRDKLAHGFWGFCPEIDDGLVCIDPKFIIKHRAMVLAAIYSGQILTSATLRIPDDAQFVWTLSCLETTERKFISVAGVVNKFTALVAGTDAQERERLRLELNALVSRM